MAEFTKAADSAAVKGKSGYAVQLNNADIALFRFNDKVYAFRDRCPHQGAPLSDGYTRDGCIVCLYHSWKFNIEDGSFINNETLKLKQYPGKEEDGQIFVMTD
jgi:nitrite reductase/ring-hydroxylating ferredoxin subunit